MQIYSVYILLYVSSADKRVTFVSKKHLNLKSCLNLQATWTFVFIAYDYCNRLLYIWWLKKTNLFSQSGGQKSEVKVPVGQHSFWKL